MTQEWRELKTLQDVAAAQAAGHEIIVSTAGGFCAWDGLMWYADRLYRSRPVPKVKRIKMLCWFNGYNLLWEVENKDRNFSDWTRIPDEDKEIEVME